MKRSIKKLIHVSSSLSTSETRVGLLGDMRERTRIKNANDTSVAASATGVELLEDMKDRLSLGGKELQRMEDESGISSKPAILAKTNALLKASNRIGTVLKAAKESSPIKYNTKISS
jgi:hypothetical protein